jgi:uncharacterized membrane protein YidH (DUF202 family)
MTSDLGRITIALAVATFLPLAGGRGRHRIFRSIAALSVVAFGCGPVLDRWEGWLIVVSATAAAAMVSRGSGSRSGVIGALLAFVAVEVVAMALLDWDRAWDAIGRPLGNDGVAVVLLGALLSMFAGGAAIGALLRPLAAGLGTADGEQKRIHAGLYIGWLERALLYGFVVAGAPGAAAVVVGLKSVARFPSFGDERFAEYYLIGTLASVLVAVGVAVAVRAILGLAPLVT